VAHYFKWATLQETIAYHFDKKVAGLKTRTGGGYGASYLSTGV